MGFLLDKNGKWIPKTLDNMYPYLDKNELLKAIK